MCSAIFGGSGSMSLLYPFDFPCQLKNWLRVQGVALEKSTLRRMSLVGSTLILLFPRSYRHPRTLRCNRTRCGGGTCRNKRRWIHRCWSRLGRNPFFFFLLLHPFRHRFGAAYQAEILSAASGAEIADV